jgi:nucleoside-diphosphate-sugar epimerase
VSAGEREPLNAGTVVVLGGTGWVGRHACTAFARRGAPVVAVARKPAARADGWRFHALDLAGASSAVLADLLRSERASVVVNATDSTNTTDGWDRTAEEHDRTNVRMVERRLDAIAGLPNRIRLVHLGTIHEYGPVVTGTAVAESHPTRPVNSYARSKLAGSRAVLAAARAGRVDGTVLRLVNLCGPDPSPDSFPGKLVALLRAGRPVVTVTAARRDFVDVRDVTAAVVAASEVDAVGRAINIGSGTVVAVADLVRIFFTEAGVPPAELDLRYGPVRSAGGEWIQADISVAGRVLDWHPRTSLRQSLRDMARSG